MSDGMAVLHGYDPTTGKTTSDPFVERAEDEGRTSPYHRAQALRDSVRDDFPDTLWSIGLQRPRAGADGRGEHAAHGPRVGGDVVMTLHWTKLAGGDLLCVEHPIRLLKPVDRSEESPGWMIETPVDADLNLGGDDWRWTALWHPGTTDAMQARNERDARALVVEQLDRLLASVDADYPEWTVEQRAKIIEYEKVREAE